jgi:hypothetical protein
MHAEFICSPSPLRLLDLALKKDQEQRFFLFLYNGIENSVQTDIGCMQVKTKSFREILVWTTHKFSHTALINL